MLKLFLRLYLILALVLALFFAAAAVLPNRLLKETLADYIQRLAQGTRSLVTARLEGLPRAEWPQAVARLGELFGYPLRLETLAGADLEAGDEARLRRGQAAFIQRDGAQVWLLPLAGGEEILTVQMDQTESEHGRRMTIGTFRLLEAQLRDLPSARWNERIEALAREFWFPLSLQPLDLPGLKADERERLAAGDVLSFGVGGNREWFLRRVEGSPWVLKLGPMEDPWPFRLLAYLVYGALALLVAVVVWVWVRPLWNGIVELRRVTAAFGRGELDVRADVAPRSSLRPLADTFNRMAERIQGLIHSHRELTDAVSHELRTPVSRLRFGMEMLEQAVADADRRRFLEGMREDVDELEDLVGELLGYARYERNGQAPVPEEILLGPWLRRLCRRASRPGTVEPRCAADDAERLQIRVDPRLLGRAVGNLLANAVKYAARQVELDARVQNDRLQIWVDDDGPGVPAVERDRVFEPFTRLDRSRDKASGGYGLGLAIVKRIAQLHGGGVELQDSPLGGARFLLWLPLGGYPRLHSDTSSQQT